MNKALLDPALKEDSLCEGLVLSGFGGFYQVLTASGEKTCKPRGRLQKNEGGIYPGDRVKMELLSAKGEGGVEGMITQVLPRFNQLQRPKVANIDQAVLVLAVDDPAPDWILLDKMLVMAAYNKIAPLICFNKCDMLSKEEKAVFLDLSAPYRKLGIPALMVSAILGEGVDELSARLRGKISVFAGPSGVGKSSLLNRLYPDLSLATGKVSIRLGRGRHTTRHVHMIPMAEDTFVADTPGFSLLDLPDDIMTRQLPLLYPDFAGLGSCRFEGCIHYKEPGCAVKQALGEGLVDEARYNRYLKIYDELKDREGKYYD